MADKIYVVPKPGLKVPDPAVEGPSRDVMLPPEGKLVARSVYWDRRLRDGDVTVGEAPKPKAAKPAPASPAADSTKGASEPVKGGKA